jgi:hypothetical protein
LDPISNAIAASIIPHAVAAGLAGAAGVAATGSYGAQVGFTLVDTVKVTIRALSDPRLVGALGGALVVTAGVLAVGGGVLMLSSLAVRKAAPIARRAMARANDAIDELAADSAVVPPPAPPAAA